MSRPSIPSATCPLHSKHKAGCTDCQTRSAERARIRNRLIAYGQWRGLVDATAAAVHCRELVAAGMTLRQLAAEAGCARSCVERLAHDNPPEMIQALTMDRILAVKPPTGGPRGCDRVDATGAARRLQALAAIGYDVDDLAPLLRANTQTVGRWRRMHWENIHFRYHQRIVAVYNRLQGTPGPSEAARAYARSHNYLPPLMWDDDTIDDPEAQHNYRAGSSMSVRAVSQALAGDLHPRDLTEAERLDVVKTWIGQGWSDRRIADFSGWAGGGAAGRRVVAQYRKRHGLQPGASKFAWAVTEDRGVAA